MFDTAALIYGFDNYYQRFFGNSTSLFSLVIGNEKNIEWSPKYDRSYQFLTERLTTSPIRDFPDPKKDFILDSDVSFEEIEAILSPKNMRDQERVIAYRSRMLTTYEKRILCYAKGINKCLVLHEFTMQIKPYLYGEMFLAGTDHKELKFIRHTNRPISPDFQKRIDNLTGVHFNLEFRKGFDHSHAL